MHYGKDVFNGYITGSTGIYYLTLACAGGCNGYNATIKVMGFLNSRFSYRGAALTLTGESNGAVLIAGCRFYRYAARIGVAECIEGVFLLYSTS